MSVLVTPRRLDDVVILDLSGRITIGEGTVVLRGTMKKLLNAGHRKFVMNLEDVDYIDSAGLGELVMLFTTVRREGGHVKLLKLTHRVRDLLQITKLLTVFDSYENEMDALKSLRA